MAYTYSKDDLRILYQSLPEKLQEVILAPETIDQYAEVAKKFSLNDKQHRELSNQSGLLLLGITQPQQFIVALTSKLGVTREQATLIAQELNKNVFNSVKDALKEVHQVMPESAKSETPAQKAVPEAETTAKPSTSMPNTAPAPVMAAPNPTTPPPAPATPPAQAKPAAAIPAMKVMPSMSAPAKPAEEKESSMGSIFEQKLGGAFRMSADGTNIAKDTGSTTVQKPAPSIMFTAPSTATPPPTPKV